MTERQAWFCPACQKHHAPHCDSCPAPVDARSRPQHPVFTVPAWPDPDTNPAPYIGDPINPIFTVASGGVSVQADPDIIYINGAH